MFIGKALFCPCIWINGRRISLQAMIAYKNKYCIVKIIFFFGSFHKFLKTIIRVCKSIVFFQ